MKIKKERLASLELLHGFGFFLTLILFSGHVSAQGLGSTDDWSRVGKTASTEGIPVVLLVTGAGCGHCDRLHRDLFTNPTSCMLLRGRAVAREIDRDAGGKLTDFDGERVRSRVFLARYQIFATPTLLFLDADGNALVEPLVGYSAPDNYRELLSERLTMARQKLVARHIQSVAGLPTASYSVAH